MPVAKGVDVEDVDCGGHSHEVGPGGGEEVPGIAVEDAPDEIGAVGGGEGDEDEACCGGEEGGDEGGWGGEVQVDVSAGEGLCDEVEGEDEDVDLDEGEVDEGEDVGEYRAVC